MQMSLTAAAARVAFISLHLIHISITSITSFLVSAFTSSLAMQPDPEPPPSNSLFTVMPFDGLCRQCNKTFKTVCSAYTHVPCTQSVLGRYQCVNCSEMFTGILKLAAHRMKKHLLGQFVCNTCTKRFHSHARITSHIQRVHMGIKKYACNQLNCISSFSKLAERALHIQNDHPAAASSLLLNPSQEVPAPSTATQNPLSEAEEPESKAADDMESEAAANDTSDLLIVLSLMKQCKTCDGYFLTERGLSEHLSKHKFQSEAFITQSQATMSSTSSPDSAPAADSSYATATPMECEDSNDQAECLLPDPEEHLVPELKGCAESQEMHSEGPAGEKSSKDAACGDERVSESQAVECTTAVPEPPAGVFTIPVAAAIVSEEAGHGEEKPEENTSAETPNQSCSASLLTHAVDESEERKDEKVELPDSDASDIPPPAGDDESHKEEQDLDVSITQEVGERQRPKLPPKHEVITIDDDDD